MKHHLFFFIFILIATSFKTQGQNYSGITFIENKGQWPKEVKFAADIPGGQLFIEEHTLTYSFISPDKIKNKAHKSHLTNNASTLSTQDYYAMKVGFLDTNNEIKVEGRHPSITQYNYFFGKDTTKWASGARGYPQVIVKDLYPGINLEISSNTDKLKYDFKLAPGANPNCIQMQYQGAFEMAIDNETLHITTPYQVLTETIPASYAICDNITRNVKSNYKLEGDIVSFELNHVDSEESLIIDPLLIFSTYSGSLADNWGNTATYDDHGNGYAGGMTNPVRGGIYLGEFPATSGAFQATSGGGWDVGILKYDSAGHNLLYATHLGGSGNDIPQSLLVNKNGELLILGITGSYDFPITSNAYDSTFNGGLTEQILGVDFIAGTDLFVAKLSSDGSQLLASTYMGGSSNDGILIGNEELSRNYGDESRGDINFDSRGNIIVSSRTSSSNFPSINGYNNLYGGGSTDAVVFKLSPSLDSLKWSTFLGGSGTDVALSVKLDSIDNVFVAGGTSSTNFPTTIDALNPTYLGNVDGWVAHIYTNGDSLISSSYIGTSAYDQVFFMDLDSNDDVYLAGQTEGVYPITSGVFSQGTTGQFIHKVSNSLKTSLFSTVINESGRTLPSISLTAFLVSDCNNIYLAGWGSPESNFSSINDNNFQLNTTGLPTTSDAYQPNSDGSSFYLVTLTGDASELLYATHLGDVNSLVHVDGGTSRFDKHGMVYHSVCASCFGDSSFPTTEGAWSQTNGSTGCNNALFKFDLASLRARFQTNNRELTNPGLAGGCLPLDVVFENLSVGGVLFEWDFGDMATSVTTNYEPFTHTYTQAGTYKVSLRASDPNTCIAEDFAYTYITISAPNFSVSNDTNICFGSSTQLIATGGDAYSWSPSNSLSNPTIFNPIATPTDTTTYTVQISNSNGCNFQDSITINVIPKIISNVQIEQTELCKGSREILIVNNSEHATNVSWDMGDGTMFDSWEPIYEYKQDGEYKILGELINQECAQNIELNLTIQKLFIPNVLTRNEDNLNDKLKITSGHPVNLSIYTRWGGLVFEEENYLNNWKGEGLTNGVYYYQVKLHNNEICTGWIHLLDGK